MAEDKKSTPPPLETLGDDKPAVNAASEPSPQVIQAGSENKNEPPKVSLVRRLRNWSKIYLLLFVLLIVVAITAATVALTWNRNQNQKQKAGSLTSEEISQLEGNVTIVGDAKQTLDIQGNTIMEGQLLVRKDVNVAGSLKVGGGLALSSVKVGGEGSFGRLAINGTLAVSGNTTFSGTTSIQKNLSVAGSASIGGTLSASQLNITTLQINDLRLSRHIITSGSLPSKSNGSALGVGGTGSINGSDVAGTVTINTGSNPPAGCFITVSFSHTFTSTPHVVISPSNSSSASLSYYTNRSSSSFSICTTNTPLASKTYLFDYVVID